MGRWGGRSALHRGQSLVMDSDFKESDHRRSPDGKFGSGSGGGQSTSESDHGLSELPTGAKFIEGKGVLGKGKWAVEIGGKMVGNLMPSKEEAIKNTKMWLKNRELATKEKTERSDKLKSLANAIHSGKEITDSDLKTMGLKTSSGLPWFIPAAAELFGISSREVRPMIKDLIKTGHSDMGAKLESVNSRAALNAIAEKGKKTGRWGGRASDAQTPKNFWSYQSSEPTPHVSELPAGWFKGTQTEWEQLSPGMRREIARQAKKSGG
jgi:hypothetical protein